MTKHRSLQDGPVAAPGKRGTTVTASLKILPVAAALLALGGLIVEYGILGHGDRLAASAALKYARLAQLLAVALFVARAYSALIVSHDKRHRIKEHLVESLLATAAAAALVAILLPGDVISPVTRHVVIQALQIYLLFELISIFVRLNTLFVRSVLHPFRGIVGSFAVLILVGALLLSLPAASRTHPQTHWAHEFVDHLFTATSAVCVTGLIVRDTGSDYTPFGQLVILILIQLGGLGIVIFGTVFAILIGRQITLREASLIQDIYSEQSLGQVRRIVIFILISTVLIEGSAAVLMLDLWNRPELSPAQQLFHSVFHAVSAYCNAGFSLQSDNMVPFCGRWQVYGVMMPLIVIGGLGFPVLLNIVHVASRRIRSAVSLPKPSTDLDRHRRVALTLQTKIVLAASAILIVGGALAVFLLESPRVRIRLGQKTEFEDIAVKVDTPTLENRPTGQRVLDALFQSVSARTAGFNTVETSPAALKPATMIVLILLMFIGGSPASAAGGVKTVTVALLLAAVVSILRGRPNIELFKRSVAAIFLRRAMVVAILFISLIATLCFVLTLTQPQLNFLELLFEATSACGTVGYSTGVTTHLSLIGRIAVIVGMFAGRLGPLTLLFALTKPGQPVRYEYPREPLVTG